MTHAEEILQVLQDGPLDHGQIANRVSFFVMYVAPALKQLLDESIIQEQIIDGRTVFVLA